MEYVIYLSSEDPSVEGFVCQGSTWAKGRTTIRVNEAMRWESRDDADNFRANSTWLRKRLTGTGLKARVYPITDFLPLTIPATPPTGGHAVDPLLGNSWGNPYDAPAHPALLAERLSRLENAFTKIAALSTPTGEELHHEIDLLRKANAKLVHDWNEERGKAANFEAAASNARREYDQLGARFTSERSRRETAEHRINELLELIANLRRYRTEDAKTITRIKRDLDSAKIALAKAQNDANLGDRQPLREKIEKQADLIERMKAHFGAISRAADAGANLDDEGAERQLENE